MATAAAPEAPPAPVEGTPPPIEEVEWQPDPRLAPRESAPASEAPVPEPVAAAPEVEGETPKAPEAEKAELPQDWKAKLAAGDTEFLAEFENDPHVKGFIAGRADFLRKQEQAAKEEADRKALRDTDPLRYVALEKEDEAKKAENEGLQTVIKTAMQAQIDPLAQWIDTYPKEVQDAYNAAVKPGTPTTLADIVKQTHTALLPHEIAKAKEQWTKEELPALFKDYLAKKGMSEPSPDLGTGTPANNANTLEQVKNMTAGQFQKWIAVASNRAQYDRDFSAGL